MQKIAIFASGNGSNAQRIIEYFRDHKDIRIKLIISNRSDAYVLERAKNLGVPSCVFSNKEFRDGTDLISKLSEYKINTIVLAGFLLKIPDSVLQLFPNRIINIHPALLPKYGGKGMYGHYVHEAVLAAMEKESGITIHLVNERYDEGEIIFQKRCIVLPDDDADSLSARINILEHRYFPKVIEKWLLNTKFE